MTPHVLPFSARGQAVWWLLLPSTLRLTHNLNEKSPLSVSLSIPPVVKNSVSRLSLVLAGVTYSVPVSDTTHSLRSRVAAVGCPDFQLKQSHAEYRSTLQTCHARRRVWP